MQKRNVKKSSFITGIGYEKNTLIVSMAGGRVYYYVGVPREVFVRFSQAKSYGKFYNKHIVGTYEHDAVSQKAV